MTQPMRAGMRWSFIQRAGTFSTSKGDFPERYAPTAFDAQIGKVVPMNYQGAPAGTCRLVAAKVSEDGTSAEFTFEAMTDHAARALQIAADPSVPTDVQVAGDLTDIGISAIPAERADPGQATCNARYVGLFDTEGDPASYQRTIRCGLSPGHRYDHEEVDTGARWPRADEPTSDGQRP